jgi:calcium-translocating P-type ATPase
VSELKGISQRLFEAYNDSCRLNTSSSPSHSGALGGNATDKALLGSVLPFYVSSRHTVIKKIPFDSTLKLSAATLQNGMTYVKGAPEKLLAYVDRCLDESGNEMPFAPLSYDLSRKIASLTSVGGRVILICRTSSSFSVKSPGRLTLVCAVLLNDRIRKEAKDSVLTLKRAGVQVVMITGDNADTAKALATDCGILDKRQTLVLTSDELSKISDDTLKKLLPELAVVARALPGDKSRLVRVAGERGLVVGMTGDGINDAPALRLSDVGFSMGSGTQVAKDAGDVIIMDDNLASICRAVLYGRSIFKSIRKFITLQLTMNFSAVGISMICPLFLGIDSPVTVVQMLWINIIMDTLGGLAFAGEAPLASYMDEAPKRRNEPILNGYMINQIVILGSFTVALCLAFLRFPSITSRFRYSPDNIYLLTAFFALFIFASIFNCFNARTDRLRLLSGISKNKAFSLIMSAVCAIQIGFVYLGGSVLRTAPLTPSELLFTLLLSLLVIPADLVRKFILKRLFKKRGKNSF